jgi:hypothetical protein
MASGVWAGTSNVQKVHEVRALDDPEASVKSELMRIGYLGSVKANWEAMPMAAHFELHIGMWKSLSKLACVADSAIIRAGPDTRSIWKKDWYSRGSPSEQMVHDHSPWS